MSFDFSRLAAGYDSWYNEPIGKMYDRLEKQAVGRLQANIAGHGRLLEIGCGTGHWSRYFSDKGFDVTGVDISAEMIKIAIQKQIPNTRFEIADGGNLPFENESFNAAAAITALEFSENPEKIIAEMARCVKPKGKLLFGVLNSLSGYNQKKQNNPESVYAHSKLFSPQQLRNLLEKFGAVKMSIAGFVVRNKRLLWLSPFWESLCRVVGSKKGAFIAAEVQL